MLVGIRLRHALLRDQFLRLICICDVSIFCLSDQEFSHYTFLTTKLRKLDAAVSDQERIIRDE